MSKNHGFEKKIEERSPKYCYQDGLKITYRAGKEVGNIFNISRYNDIFKLIKKMESNIKEKLPISVELNFITLEALKIYQEENGDFSKLEEILGNNLFYLLNDISMYNISKSSKIADTYLNDDALKKLNDFYNNNLDIVLFAYEKNCSSLYIFDILQSNKNYVLLNNLYNAIRGNESLKKSIASKLILDFEALKKNSLSDKRKEELYYKMERINKKFNSIDFEKLKNISISIDDVFDYIV